MIFFALPDELVLPQVPRVSMHLNSDPCIILDGERPSQSMVDLLELRYA